MSGNLRVATLWAETVVEERVFRLGRPVSFGTGPGNDFTLPESAGLGARQALFRVLDGAPVALLPIEARGEVRSASGRTAALGGGALRLAVGMRGLFRLGPIEVFFEVLPEAPRPSRWEGFLAWLATINPFPLLSATAINLGILLVAFLTWQDPATARAAAVLPETPTPAPSWERVQVELEPPAIKNPGEAAPRHHGDEGRAGEPQGTQRSRAPRRDTPEPANPTRRLESLLASDALRDVMGGRETQFKTRMDAGISGHDSDVHIGQGAGGVGLRGLGSGGGGTSVGSLYGMGGPGLGGTGGGGGRGRARTPPRGPSVVPTCRDCKPGQAAVEPCNPEDIRRTVEARRHGVSYCYEKALMAEPELEGKVTLVWRIDPAGDPRAVQIESTTLRARAAELCMVEAVRRWRFPPPRAGQCQVRYPFVFAASSR